MANKYDAPKMKTCAGNIETQLESFIAARRKVDNLVEMLDNNAWNDENNRRFVQRYRKDVEQTAAELEEILRDTASIMHQCAKRFGNATDNGSSYLSS